MKEWARSLVGSFAVLCACFGFATLIGLEELPRKVFHRHYEAYEAVFFAVSLLLVTPVEMRTLRPASIKDAFIRFGLRWLSLLVGGFTGHLYISILMKNPKAPITSLVSAYVPAMLLIILTGGGSFFLGFAYAVARYSLDRRRWKERAHPSQPAG